MKIELFAVKDRKANLYGQIMMAINPLVMVRDIRSKASDENHPWRKFPEDYELYRVGTFWVDTGVVSGRDVQGAEPIMSMLDVLSEGE